MPMLWRFLCKICFEAACTASFSSCSGPRSFGFAFRPSEKSRGLTRVSASGYIRSVFKIDMLLEAVLNEPALSLHDRFCHIRAIQGHVKTPFSHRLFPNLYSSCRFSCMMSIHLSAVSDLLTSHKVFVGRELKEDRLKKAAHDLMKPPKSNWSSVIHLQSGRLRRLPSAASFPGTWHRGCRCRSALRSVRAKWT